MFDNLKKVPGGIMSMTWSILLSFLFISIDGFSVSPNSVEIKDVKKIKEEGEDVTIIKTSVTDPKGENI